MSGASRRQMHLRSISFHSSRIMFRTRYRHISPAIRLLATVFWYSRLALLVSICHRSHYAALFIQDKLCRYTLPRSRLFVIRRADRAQIWPEWRAVNPFRANVSDF